MTLLLTSRTFLRLTHLRCGVRAQSRGGAARDSCSPREPAPCPPCERAPPPACRRTTAAACPRAVRVLCCAPPAGSRPPCAPPQPPCPLSCEHAHSDNTVARSSKEAEYIPLPFEDKCGAELDRVAQRIKDAESIRRSDYEKEVATARPPAVAAAATYSTYSLAAERRCLRATDGREYAVQEGAGAAVQAGAGAAVQAGAGAAVQAGAGAVVQAGTEAAAPRCGPCRETPPPCPVQLESEDACQIQRDQHLDPCAHLPRVFVEIDRYGNTKAIAPKSPAQTDSCASKQTESLTTRIMEKLRRGSSTSCPRQVSTPKCEGGGARYAGDENWCKSPPAPVVTKAPCQESSLVERLRRRPGGTGGENCNPRRAIHTGSSYNTCGTLNKDDKITPSEVKTKTDKLKEVLQDRKKLKEAGQGRVVADCKQEKPEGAGGCLELHVPPTTEKVRVQVSLDFNSTNPTTQKNCCSTTTVTKMSDAKKLFSPTAPNDSWLFLRSIQKKFAISRKNDKTTVEKYPSSGSCPRPQKVNPVPMTHPPCTPSSSDKLPKGISRDPCRPKCTFSTSSPPRDTVKLSSLEQLINPIVF